MSVSIRADGALWPDLPAVGLAAPSLAGAGVVNAAIALGAAKAVTAFGIGTPSKSLAARSGAGAVTGAWIFSVGAESVDAKAESGEVAGSEGAAATGVSPVSGESPSMFLTRDRSCGVGAGDAAAAVVDVSRAASGAAEAAGAAVAAAGSGAGASDTGGGAAADNASGLASGADTLGCAGADA